TSVPLVPLSVADKFLAARIARREPDPDVGKVVLAGSGVSHFDSRVIRARMPHVQELLNYRQFDVGIMRIQYLHWTKTNLTDVNDDKTHRAMDDVRCHLKEAQAFRQFFIDGSAQK